TEIDNVVDVKDELVNAAEEYNNFSGIDDDMNGKVRFVLKVQESEDNDDKENTDKQDISSNKDNTEEKQGFFDWIKGLFNK
ncbi:MAG: hypothetical protein ACI4PU_01305, partial [Intestinibacter sp.]